ncbi:MAG: VanW family protein [Clostridia bacterium]|nr:VanW family protein [Clostridia bacterium]
MKRIILFCLAVIFILLPSSYCLSDDITEYTAKASCRFHLRDTPDGRKLVNVPEGEKIQIIELADDWCLAEYHGVTGYCKTAWIYSLISLDPHLYPSPQIQYAPTGYIVMTGDTWIQAGKFDGTTVSAGKQVCASYGSDGSCRLPVWRSEQTMDVNTVEYYPFVAWENAEPGDVIGGFTTFYSGRQGKKHPEGRESNILTGCGRINGCIISVGETFSFNKYCSPYTKGNGYRLAPNISREREGYGGGICQVTTTLYNAVLTLPLKIEAWSIHKYTGVSYVPQFFDAAVGKYSDFSFINTLPYPICIQATAENGVINIIITRAENDVERK